MLLPKLSVGRLELSKRLCGGCARGGHSVPVREPALRPEFIRHADPLRLLRFSSATACGFAASRRACRPTVGIDPEVDPVDAGLVSTTSFATKGYQLAGSVPIIQSGGDCYPYSLKGNIFSLDLVKDSGYGGYAKPMAS
jgi:hypothetical protein